MRQISKKAFYIQHPNVKFSLKQLKLKMQYQFWVWKLKLTRTNFLLKHGGNLLTPDYCESLI